MRTVREPRNRFAVTDFVIGGEEVSGVEAETPRVVHTGLVESGGHLVGTVPAQVASVDIYGRGRIAGQRVDGVANQVEPFLALVTRQAVGHGECIGFDDDRRRRSAQVGSDAVDPRAVVCGRREATRSEATAVAVWDSIERQNRDGASRLRVTGVL